MPEISRFLGIIIYMYFNEHSPPHFHARYETFAKLHKTHNFVIPAKAGIQYFQIVPGFRVKPGMTNKGVIQ